MWKLSILTLFGNPSGDLLTPSPITKQEKTQALAQEQQRADARNAQEKAQKNAEKSQKKAQRQWDQQHPSAR